MANNSNNKNIPLTLSMIEEDLLEVAAPKGCDLLIEEITEFVLDEFGSPNSLGGGGEYVCLANEEPTTEGEFVSAHLIIPAGTSRIEVIAYIVQVVLEQVDSVDVTVHQ